MSLYINPPPTEYGSGRVGKRDIISYLCRMNEELNFAIAELSVATEEMPAKEKEKVSQTSAVPMARAIFTGAQWSVGEAVPATAELSAIYNGMLYIVVLSVGIPVVCARVGSTIYGSQSVALSSAAANTYTVKISLGDTVTLVSANRIGSVDTISVTAMYRIA